MKMNIVKGRYVVTWSRISIVCCAMVALTISRTRQGAFARAAEGKTNRLASASSPYLRSAAHQPIDWYAWSPEAFDRAKKENKPVLLDIGAVWCHWCHVMDRTTYEDADMAKYLNEHFICIKVDRDERPDIDRRYQEAAIAVGASGWPLTAFLTPEGKLFAAGTYFPPRDSDGRVGLQATLELVIKAWSARREQVLQTADRIQESVVSSGASRIRGVYSPIIVDHIWNSILSSYDRKNHGFGKPTGVSEVGVPLGPKFPLGSPIELALVRYFESRDDTVLQIAKKTLNAMADGGMHDQIGGGFHRYSMDASWRIPHFEKMLHVQAELLHAYATAFQVTGAQRYRDLSNDIIEYVSNHLTDAAGGFFASQDADNASGVDGAYYTWTQEEVARILSPEEYNVGLSYYGLDDRRNRMEGSERYVLQRAFSYEQLGQRLNKPVEKVQSLVESGRHKLMEARIRREPPYIDRTVYINWNAMMVSAYIQAYRAFGSRSLRDFALKTCDRLLDKAYRKGEGMVHRLRPGDSMPEPTEDGEQCLLDDQAQMARALLDAYEVSANAKYLNAARDLMEFAHAKFWDVASGAFFDRIHDRSDVALLEIKEKSVEDSPTPAANSVAISALRRLAISTGENRYHDWGERTLRALSARAQEFGRFSAAFALAAHNFFNPAPTAFVIGKRPELKTQLLWSAALRTYRPGAIVFLRDPSDSNMPHPPSKDGSPVAYMSVGRVSSPPITNTKELIETLQTLGVNKTPTTPSKNEKARVSSKVTKKKVRQNQQ